MFFSKYDEGLSYLLNDITLLRPEIKTSLFCSKSTNYELPTLNGVIANISELTISKYNTRIIKHLFENINTFGTNLTKLEFVQPDLFESSITELSYDIFSNLATSCPKLEEFTMGVESVHLNSLNFLFYAEFP